MLKLKNGTWVNPALIESIYCGSDSTSWCTVFVTFGGGAFIPLKCDNMAEAEKYRDELACQVNAVDDARLSWLQLLGR